MNTADCSCQIRNRGTRAEMRVLDRSCPRHGSAREAFCRGYDCGRAELAQDPAPGSFGAFAWTLIRAEPREVRASLVDGLMAACEDHDS